MSSLKTKKKRIDELNELAQAPDESIDYSDIPELDDSFWKRAVIEFPKRKRSISIRLDEEIIQWYKSHFSEYQTAMNAVLKSYMRSKKG